MVRRVCKVIAIILLVVFLFVLLYSLLFGNLGLWLRLVYPKLTTHFKDFAEYKDDFAALCVFLRIYYTENGCSGEVYFNFKENKLSFDETVITVDILTQQIAAARSKGLFEGWVDEDKIIFWEDETKYYGLLYSEQPISSLISIKKWHYALRSNKLDRYWYEIGVLDGR